MKKLIEVITLESCAESFIGDQLSFLQKKGGYEVHLICSPSPNLQHYVEANGVRCKEVEIERQLSIKKDIKALKEISSYIRKEKFDVLIAHSFPKAFFLSTIAAVVHHVPVRIEVSHGAVYETLPFFMRYMVLLCEKIITSFATKVICVSPSVIKSRLHYRLNRKEKMCLLSKGTCNGVDTIHKFNPALVLDETIRELRNELKISNEDFVIGYCGRLVRDKGIVELLDGFQVIKNRYPEKSIKLLIVGNPEQRDALPQQTMDCIDNSTDIIFTGRVNYELIQNYYPLMDVFVLPSYREGFPTVVLEASSMERAVITTRKTGCVDSIVENETGVFAEIEGDSIANAIELFFDKQLAITMGKNGRKWVAENFEHTVVSEAMLQLIDSLTK